MNTKRIGLLLGLVTLALGLLVVGHQQRGNSQTPAPLGSRQFGTASDDGADAVTTDQANNVYVAGHSGSSLFGPDTGKNQMFVLKCDPSGNILWSKQFGTDQDEGVEAIAVDRSGNIFVGGSTDGSLFGANHGGGDGFVAKVDSTGRQLWGKQFGTSEEDQLLSIALDGQGNVFAVGTTQGSLFGPTTGPDPNGQAVEDSFIVKLDADGNQLWGQQFGADDADEAEGVTVDPQGNAFVVGSTEIGNTKQLFAPVSGENHAADAYIAKFSPAGTLLWGKQFSDQGAAGANAVCADSGGSLFVVGDLDVPDAVSTAAIAGGANPDTIVGPVFIARFDADGNQLWLKPIGTSGAFVSSVTCDGQGNAVLAGNTFGSLLGPSAGAEDAFVVKYDSNGNQLWGRQFGTSSKDDVSSVAVDSQGSIYAAGATEGALFGPNLGGDDAFLAKFTPDGQVALGIRHRRSLHQPLQFAWSGLATNLLYPPFLINGLPYLYVGYLCSGVPGAKVSYRKTKQIVIDNQRGRRIVLSSRGFDYSLNGKARKMAAKPVLVDGRCYVPLDVMQAVLPFPVSYQAKTRTVRFDPPRLKQARK